MTSATGAARWARALDGLEGGPRRGSGGSSRAGGRWHGCAVSSPRGTRERLAARRGGGRPRAGVGKGIPTFSRFALIVRRGQIVPAGGQREIPNGNSVRWDHQGRRALAQDLTAIPSPARPHTQAADLRLGRSDERAVSFRKGRGPIVGRRQRRGRPSTGPPAPPCSTASPPSRTRGRSRKYSTTHPRSSSCRSAPPWRGRTVSPRSRSGANRTGPPAPLPCAAGTACRAATRRAR
jgi:hypothetical protein